MRLTARNAQLLLLAAITLAHIATRLEALRQYPLNKRQFYPETFRYSLAVMAGHGLRPVPFSGDPTSIPLQDFLSLQADSISPDDFARWQSAPHDTTWPMERFLTYEDQHMAWPLYTTRVLDLLAAAGIWKLFGIHWDHLFLFYLALSATGPPCLWLVTRAVSGCGWTGLAGALLYACNPLEMVFTSFSPRDISPLWFAAPAWASLACLVGRVNSWRHLAASCLLTGFLAGLGLGFRHDALVTCAAVAALSLPMALASGLGWAKALAAPAGCWVGTRAVVAALHLACPAPAQQSGVGFHMAYYAEETRCSLFRLENSAGISRDDLQVMQRVAHEKLEQGLAPIPLDASRCAELYGPDHARLTRDMLFRTLRANAWTWLTRAPEFAWRALQATLLEDLPIGGHIRIHPLRNEPIGGMGRHLLAPMAWIAQAGPALFVAGLVLIAGAGLAPGPRERILALGLGLFAFGYAGVLFLVLPEVKHAGLLVVPMCALGAAGLGRLARLLSPEGRAETRAGLPWRWIRLTATASGAALAVWAGLAPAAWVVSRGARAETVETVRGLAAAAEWRTNPGDPFTQELTRKGDELRVPEIWLLEVEAEESGVRLACRQAHHDTDPPLVQYYQSPSTLFQTWHRIPRGGTCLFALSLTGHGAFGDTRPDQVRVDILGKGKILRAARVPMEGRHMPWLRTVVSSGDGGPGNPGLRSFTRSGLTMHGTNTRIPVLGMRPEHVTHLDNPATKQEREDEEEGYDPMVRKPQAKRPK